jgi:hypothetical protein
LIFLFFLFFQSCFLSSIILSIIQFYNFFIVLSG